MSFRESRPIEVLLVEDNEGDVRLMRETFKEGRVLNNLRVVNDGVEAMKYLRGRTSLKVMRNMPTAISPNRLIWSSLSKWSKRLKSFGSPW